MKLLAAVMCGFALLVAGCGGAKTKVDLRGTAGKNISHAGDLAVPTQILGLTVKAEDVSQTVVNSQRAYIDSLVMYGLRKDNLLQATFQVSRFNPGAKYTAVPFKQAVVNQIGNEAPVTIVVGGQTVYLTVGNKQRIWIWFKGPYFFVLAARQDYTSPRALLRELLAVGS